MVRSIPRTSSLALALSAAAVHGASVPPVRRAGPTGFQMAASGNGVRHTDMKSLASGSSSSAVTISDYQDSVVRYLIVSYRMFMLT